VYWDVGRSVWSLCPVEVPPSAEPEVSTVPSASSTAANGRRDTHAGAHAFPTSVLNERGSKAEPRQDESRSGSASSVTPVATTRSVSSISNTLVSTSTSTAEPSIVHFSQSGPSSLLQIGDYNCTSKMTLDFLASIISSFLDDTDTTTDATLTFLSLNIHAAASYQSPDAPARQVDAHQMPGSGNLLSDIMNGNLSDGLYTPLRLQDERGNLNQSWYGVAWDIRPAMNYYETSRDSSNHLNTQNGWPTEAYMEFKKLFRLVTGFGTIDPQMLGYNITADLDTIFPPGTLHNLHTTAFSPTGEVTSGCLFNPSTPSLTSDTNSSWALSLPPALNLGPNPNTAVPIASITNLTSCGHSPYLNTTLSNVTADQTVQPYIAFAHSLIWSWAPGSPANTTDTDSGATAERCVAMHTSPYAGRWTTLDCTERHLAACQSPTNPYHWEISASQETYPRLSCPPDTIFSVPHTALENSYLLDAMQSHPSRPDTLYLNLNALDVPDCWVEGINGTCPYIPRTDTNKVRIVVVPTVAAVVIFLMAALTFFVKCAANRREDKRGRRRRNVGGWEYEGVPS
jgi:hypothetical protein